MDSFMDSKYYSSNQEILIVEDSPTQAEELKFLLEKQNYRVSVAYNGKEALALLDKHKPMIIISDIVMPEMDGYQFCRHIKNNENFRDIPVILLTGLADPQDVLEGLECGADNFVTKPFNEKYLISRIHYLRANRLMHTSEKLQIGVKIFFGGKEYYITSERQQILNLLLSTYETAVQKNLELQRAQDELRVLNEQLEEKVEERTAALKAEIDDRKRAEESLKESEERFRNVVESALNPVIIADNIGRIISWNRSAWDIFLYTEKEVLGKQLSFLMPERYRANHLAGLKRITSTGESNVIGRIVEMHGLRKDGTEFPLEISISSWKTEKGIFFSGIIHDITERKKAEEMRLEKERLEYASKEKSEFIASMGHELRTPLNSIIGFSELLHREAAGALNEKQRRYVDNTITSGKFLLNLINEILDLSKIEAGKIDLVIEKISVPDTIEETITLMKEKATKHNIAIKKEFDSQLGFIDADKLRFKQILFNLLSNAIKFSKEEGGTLTIKAKNVGGMAQISVSDTGIGIRHENMKKLFQKFEQLEPGISSKYGGTGLGLSISKQLVEQHGGKIWAESKYGEGSIFTISLPISAKRTGEIK